MPENQVFGRAAGGGISSQKFVEKGRKLWYDKSNMGFEKKEKNDILPQYSSEFIVYNDS